ncbi:restriction endonuclease subunit S [Salmonella enterica]|uniref:Restriction endonuclease subunit S n=1 Tax=Salmonella enterica subsp. houtenae serovar 45:g,z51:- TaxID=1967611 RepID=A0A753AZ14_SALHO|nr:restriction endonuclease subunit S [Salmonella enterica]EBP3957733.1 restriction endonuclease subunit S [Salmonella enterica subsp. enterica]HAF0292792.1 restriction endonuclease subunit S [Salmonella enterica subsp. houtenae serovar 43:z4,z32:-]AXD30469.1 restriction endonuclease subunit S [Salmonella enterica]EAB6269353.1 restriction endonuclease subunit S [Salmonella enterica subsp. houtenae]EAN8731133.1 restriction endonuclease subunit S [Salmonella enterica]
MSKNWQRCQLGDVLTLINGRAYKKEEMLTEGVPILRIQNLNGGNKWFYSNLDLAEDKYCYKDDLLYAWSATFGPYWSKWDHKLIYHYHIWKIETSSVLYKQFAYYALWNITEALKASAHGVAMPHITKAGMEAWEIDLPPLTEQKVIAEKLDTLLAQVDSTKARLERITQILKRFRQAVLASVVCGKLSKNTGQWKTYSLKSICTSISDGDHQAPPKSETGIPFLVISDVNKGQIDFENVSRWVPESYYESLKEIRKPFQNDILYTVTGSYGIPVIVNTTKPFCFQRHIAIIKPNSSLIDYKFLAFYLESPQIFKHASDVATGTAQKTVSLSSLRNFELSVPSLEEQAEIVRRVEQLFAYADTIEKQVNNALTRVNSLTQSILAKAFRGELTAQWRAENPELISGENSAAALLEKIKAERAASGGKKTSRKKA